MKKLCTSLFTCSLLFLNHFTYAQTLTPELELLLNETLDSMHTVLGNKSLSAAIQYPNDQQWANAEGISSNNPLVNVTPEDAYEIGSVVKTITSACILQLHDEGFLSIEDSIGEWIDDTPNVNPDITIRQLMQHKSGLYDVFSNPSFQVAINSNIDSVWDAQVLIETFIEAPIFSPGAAWSYCNTNYLLLGIIIEEATGNPFYVEMRNRFFDPLALSTFGIPSFEPYTEPIAHVWMDITGDGVTEDAHWFYMIYNSLNSAAGAAGGYFARPSDVSKWMRTYMRGDLISDALMEDALTTSAAPGLPGTTYGLGVMRKMFEGCEGFGHGGDLGYSASSWYFPEKDISITVCNNDADVISWDLAPVVAALLKTIKDYDELNSSISDDTDEEPSVVVYPNPFSNQFTVQLEDRMSSKNFEIYLYNAMGEVLELKVVTGTGEKQSRVLFDQLNDLASGIYFIEIVNDHFEKTILKVVK
jgi:D-alanyl-D-alanine carboxypeptidase